MSELLKCGNCGHYHFAILKEDIEQNVISFSVWLKTLTQNQINWHYCGHLPEAPTFENCFGCGVSYTEMIADDGKCPNGVTLQGIRRV